MKQNNLFRFIMLPVLILSSLWPSIASAQVRELALQRPVVRAVMFWSDSCGRCHYVLENVLPPLQSKYGDQLDILLVELKTAEDVDRLYQTAEALGFPKEEVGVPFLVIGERVLTGSEQIPAELPGLVEKHLAEGGLDYPDMPALAGILPEQASEPGSPDSTQPASADQVVEARQPVDSPPGQVQSNGFTLAILIMIGMFVALVYTGVIFVRGSQAGNGGHNPAWLNLATPVLALVGLGVAGYLSYVETQPVTAVCGPIGDCNAVQNSPYARLFGVLPVGVLGAIGYILILAAWVLKRFFSGRLVNCVDLTSFGIAFFGTIFSLYLTFLEPFVIRAVCAWCLSSAVLITLLMLLNTRPAVRVVEKLQGT